MKKIFSDTMKEEYTVLFRCPFLKSNQLHVNVNETFAYKALERKDMMQMIEQEWTEILKRKPYFFDMSKFRYHDGSYNELNGGKCTLNLGLTQYKYYVGTNLSSHWKYFYDEGVKNGDENMYFGNPMGNQTIIVLNDGYHVLLNRGSKVGENPNMVVCVGGHPEPTHCNITNYEDAKKVSSETLSNQLFSSMNRELHEEANIPFESIKDTRMIAMMRSNTVHGREVQLFCTFVDLNKEQVQKYYLKGPEDQEESSGINFFKYDDIIEMISVNPKSFADPTRCHYSVLNDLKVQFDTIFDEIFH